jgi:L-2-hydroxyglutarate oxidase LhgO
MFFKYWRYGLGEYIRAFSRKSFLKQLKRLIPSLQDDDIKPCKTGVRAQALEKNGELIDDFRIERKGNSIHILNAPSPAATASLAIGDYINETVSEYFNLPITQNQDNKSKKVKAKKHKSAKTSKSED